MTISNRCLDHCKACHRQLKNKNNLHISCTPVMAKVGQIPFCIRLQKVLGILREELKSLFTLISSFFVDMSSSSMSILSNTTPMGLRRFSQLKYVSFVVLWCDPCEFIETLWYLKALDGRWIQILLEARHVGTILECQPSPATHHALALTTG